MHGRTDEGTHTHNADGAAARIRAVPPLLMLCIPVAMLVILHACVEPADLGGIDRFLFVLANVNGVIAMIAGLTARR
jgi:hypothetical protein